MKIEDWIAPENLGFIAFGVLIGAVAMVGAEAACDADVAARSQRSSFVRAAAPVEASSIDEEFLRCANLPIEQAADPTCRALWAAQRQKFLAPKKDSNDATEPLELFPTEPAAPKSPASHTPFAVPSSESE